MYNDTDLISPTSLELISTTDPSLTLDDNTTVCAGINKKI